MQVEFGGGDEKPAPLLSKPFTTPQLERATLALAPLLAPSAEHFLPARLMSLLNGRD